MIANSDECLRWMVIEMGGVCGSEDKCEYKQIYEIVYIWRIRGGALNVQLNGRKWRTALGTWEWILARMGEWKQSGSTE